MEQRSLKSLQHDACTCLLVALKLLCHLGNFLGSMDVSGSTAGDNTFLCCCSRRIQSVLHTEFCLFHLCLGSSAYTDHCNTAGQFCKSLLQFFFIKIRCGLLNLLLDLSHSCLNCFLVACAINNDSILFLNLNGFCTAKLIQLRLFQIQTEFFRNHLAACEDCNILKHCFSSVAIAGCLDCNYVEGSAQLVNDQCGKSLALDILRDDQQFSTGLNDLLKDRKDLLNVADLLICDQDIRIFQNCFHLIHIGSHICGDITSVKLHTFYQIQLCLHSLALFDGDHAVACHLLHSVRNHVSDFLIP